jgi:hypothetical protein
LVFARVIYRRWSGKFLLRPKFANPLFEETWQSGRSLRGIVTRFCGANRCLWIVVTDGVVHIGPHFPFNLFAPDCHGLEHSIPGETIIAVDRIDRLFWSPKVRIQFRKDLIGEEAFEIDCKRPDELIAALEEIRSKI